MRTAGILLPVSSLPSPYGIGNFGRSAREFIDMLVSAKQTFWQILPLGPTGYGDSPYQAFSAFAGNPYFIDLDQLIEEGLLSSEEVQNADFGQTDPMHVDYAKLYQNRIPLLRKACERSHFEEEDGYRKFLEKNTSWLKDYAYFMGIKRLQGGNSWQEWPQALRMHDAEAIADVENEIAPDIRFHSFLQYKFDMQWKDLKAYANGKGIQIIGDIPIYVSPDSSDAWANSELFQFDENRRPTSVAGCPPDAFAWEGQLWGNPLYDWKYHEETGFAWWKKRIKHCLSLYDVVRIDHFRGFDEYFSIPAGDTNALGGHWEKGPGMRLFDALHDLKKMSDSAIIAEDLGFLTNTVKQLVKDSGFPSMKVLEFAFDSRDTGSGYLPHCYHPNTVVYTGTHDNQTLAAWFGELEENDRCRAMDYMGFTESTTPYERNWAFIRMAMESVSDTCVIPIQDYLILGAEARMNRPSKLGGNWTWRLQPGQIEEALPAKIRRLTEITERVPE